MNSPLFFAALLSCLGSPFQVLAATDYFASPAGDDVAGDGSSGNPWRTITRATQAAASGDRILVEAGTYNGAAGESFPVLVPNGVSLLGPQSGGEATLQTQSAAQPALRLTVGPDPTTVADLRVVHLGLRTAIETFGSHPNPGTISILRNTVEARAVGIGIDGGSVLVEENVVIDLPNAFSEPAIEVEDCQGGVLRNNSISGGYDGIALGTPFQGDFSDLTISGNLIEDTDRHGILVGRELTNVTFRDNRILGAGQNGMFFDGKRFSGLVEGNSIHGSSEDGFEIRFSSGSSQDVVFDAPVRFNSISTSGGKGISVFAQLIAASSSGSGATAHMDFPLYGNSTRDNADDGLWVWGSADFGPFFINMPDLGGGPAGLGTGRNTLFGNGGDQLEAFGHQLPAYMAEGNWWGTTNLSVIDNRVNGSVDFDPPLARVMTVSLSRSTVRQTGGQLVTATADPGGAFVPYEGENRIHVTLGGVAATEVVISEDGSSVSFRSPPVPDSGQNLLLIRNPNTTEATAVLQVKPVRWLADGPLPAR